MKKITIKELGATCYLATSFEELEKTPAALEAIKAVYMDPGNMAGKLALLRVCFKAPEKVWTALEAPNNRDELWRLLQHLDWVMAGPKTKPFPFLILNRKKYHLPDEDLTFLSTAEFVIATAHLIGFWTAAQNNQDGRESLARFMAVICRPGSLRIGVSDTGDKREVFHSVKAENRWKKFIKLDLATQLMVAQWFNNAANNCLKRFGMAGDGGDGDGASQALFVRDWEQQIIKVAESSVYGNYDNVMGRGVHDVLNYIALKRMEEEEKHRKAS